MTGPGVQRLAPRDPGGARICEALARLPGLLGIVAPLCRLGSCSSSVGLGVVRGCRAGLLPGRAIQGPGAGTLAGVRKYEALARLLAPYRLPLECAPSRVSRSGRRRAGRAGPLG